MVVDVLGPIFCSAAVIAELVPDLQAEPFEAQGAIAPGACGFWQYGDWTRCTFNSLLRSGERGRVFARCMSPESMSTVALALGEKRGMADRRPCGRGKREDFRHDKCWTRVCPRADLRWRQLGRLF